MNKSQSLFIVAAGSGGHILPALVLGKQWAEKQSNASVNVYFFTSNTRLDQKIVHDHPFLTKIIGCSLTKFSLSQWWKLPLLLFQMVTIFCKTLNNIRQHQPEKIISTGGLLSIPVCIAGFFSRTPVELYELNVVPGKATTLLLPFASTVFVIFEQTKKLCQFFGRNFSDKCRKTNYPLRFTKQDTLFDRDTIIQEINHSKERGLSFTPDRKTLFVIGGSQGSIFLNQLIRNACINKIISGSSVQIIHQTGDVSQTEWQQFYAEHNIAALTFSFEPNIARFYLISDLVVARAGAGTLFEIEFFKKRCIIIPLVAQTTTHQIDNALALEKEHPGLFTMLTEKDIKNDLKKVEALVTKLLHLCNPQLSAINRAVKPSTTPAEK